MRVNITQVYFELFLRGGNDHLVDLCISHQLLSRVVRVETIATKDLDGVGGGLIGDVAGEALGNGGGYRVLLSHVSLPDKIVDHNFVCTLVEGELHTCQADFMYANLAHSVPMAMSANMKLTAWWLTMAVPKVFLSVAYFVASSRALWLIPVAPEF